MTDRPALSGSIAVAGIAVATPISNLDIAVQFIYRAFDQTVVPHAGCQLSSRQMLGQHIGIADKFMVAFGSVPELVASDMKCLLFLPKASATSLINF